MKNALDPIGPQNDMHILEQAKLAHTIIFAWGVHGSFMGRDRLVKRALSDFDCYNLGVTKDGHPKHPLYLRGDTEMKSLEHTKENTG